MTRPILIFDLDGTLIDSAPDIHAACARLLEGEGEQPLAFEVIRSFIGNGVPVLIDRIIAATALDPARKDRYLAAFLEDYGAHATDLTFPYPGVIEALDAFRKDGFSLAVCTNKPEAPTLAILSALQLEGYFEGVVGGDTLADRKPDPAGLIHLRQRLGHGPVVFVGDSEVDAETALRAGVPFALFSQGYCKVPFSDLTFAGQFQHFADLRPLVFKLLAEMPVPARG
ncbi:phosphoglycolate phosphatase [Roseibium aquae]|uniref:Phosphoglycolate phosphatase n=1 Tax=Roseibium aquae TaxID=1323746 RepID=A0A916T8X0_9HYPH|nr:phosphoglycolate phosphatase [Roseibium aquae]GGB36254.1 phosphoglycolate phosphatase [Roseibium aquae]